MNYFLHDADYWRPNICCGAATVGEAFVKPEKTQQRSVRTGALSGNVTATTSEGPGDGLPDLALSRERAGR